MTWSRRMLDCAVLLGVLICASPLSAQSVQQSGVVTPTHFACWTTGGVIQDCGVAAQPFASTGGAQPGPWCVNSGPVSGPYQSFCLNANSSTGGILSIQNFGGAAAGGISFNINGATAGIATVNLPTISGDLAAFNNVSGGIIDSGISTSGPAIWQNDQYFGSGRPWCDVRAQGAIGNGVTNDHAAIAACVSQMVMLSGGIIYFPPGHYCDFSGTSSSTSGMIYRGAGRDATILDACGHDVTLITLNGLQGGVEDMVLLGNNALTASQPAIHLNTLCVGCFLFKLRMSFGGECVKNDSSDVVAFINDCNVTYGFALWENTSGAAYYNRLKLDMSFPVCLPSGAPAATFPAWQANHSYTGCNVVSTGGFLINENGNCTSGSGAPTLQIYGTSITDGTCTWQLALPVVQDALLLHGASSQIFVTESDFTYVGRSGINISSTGNSFTIFHNSFSQGSFNVWAQQGSGLFLYGNTMGGTTAGTESFGISVLIDSTWTTDAIVQGNIIFNNQYGVIDNKANATITGNQVFGSTIAGIRMIAGTSNFTINSNQCGTDATYAGANAIGIQVDTGSSDNYSILGNNCIGAVTPISDGGTGTHKIVFNPGVVASLTAANIYGGSAAGSTLNLQSTSSGSPSGDTITLTTGGTVRATILSGGNFGFGTETNPQYSAVFSTNATTGSTLAPNAFGGPWAFGATSAVVGWNTLAIAASAANNFIRADNTLASPSNLANGEMIGSITFGGYGNGAIQSGRARIFAQTSEAWSGTTFGTLLEFDTTAAGGSRAQAMLIKAGVIIGSGTTDPGAGNLTVGGTIAATLSNTATTSAVCYNTSTGLFTYDGTIGTCNTSTRRVKHDIQPLQISALDAVMRMQPVSFYYNADQHTPGQQLGFIAEDLQKIDPRLVALDRDGQPFAIRFLGPMFSYVVGAIHQLKADNDNLHRELTALKRKIK